MKGFLLETRHADTELQTFADQHHHEAPSATSGLSLDKHCEHTRKLRVFAMKWGSAARRLPWTDSSLARATQGEKSISIVPKTKQRVSILIIFFYKQDFWFCNQHFKEHIFHLPHAPALLFVWEQLQTWKNLSFKLHRMSPVLRSHSSTSVEQAHEGPCETTSAGTSQSQVICCNQLRHEDFFTKTPMEKPPFLPSWVQLKPWQTANK